jgi:hypothetical protein
VFTTAGYGPVPAEVDQHLAEVDAALDQVEQLPVIGSACDTVGAAGEYPDWEDYSAKGFYAYNWQGQEDDGPYLRLSSPAVPISVDQLPAEIRDAAQLAEVPLKFADKAEITF